MTNGATTGVRQNRTYLRDARTKRMGGGEGYQDAARLGPVWADAVLLSMRFSIKPTRHRHYERSEKQFLIWHNSRGGEERPRPPCGGGTGWGVGPHLRK